MADSRDPSAAVEFDTAVWFDLDGTLVTVGDYAAVVDRACVEAGVDPDAPGSAYDDRFVAAFEALADDPYRRAATGALAELDADPDAFVAALREAEFAAAETSPALRERLARLAADDRYAVGVLTDGLPGWQAGKLERVGLAGYVDATLASYEVGAHKPDPAAFVRAEERLPADDRVMVGDDPEADVAAARARGWRAFEVDGPDAAAAVLDALDSL
ncbi:HAD family hydrolase [Candidatus Halobonum tyrrellensis]|uniref:Putative haloacid dehalogenase hydrolase n=1 Tax=Candidatus Halobonum tyrrellensis G22 TaxID=1324957 RepID=V4H9X1_9EURY|nr:HAD family hydrolase [Candidatus Halobonum tyrrellensis]ESP87500.1 putative haloacid dehalogenase hydrolase [Candidatus Halobonum tyrrellensis G22]